MVNVAHPNNNQNLEAILSRFEGVRRNGSSYQALCPAHADKNPSLSIAEKDGRILVHCFAGCATETVLERAGLTTADLFVNNGQGKWREVCSYPYDDEAGVTLFKIVREEQETPDGRKKRFRAYVPDGRGGWKSGQGCMNGVRRVLYHLRGVLAASEVIVNEGEKDADTAISLGFVGTTNVFGANAEWLREYSDSLRGRNVPIIADADPTGRKRAQEIATALHLIAASVKVLEMPGAKDLTEWVERGGTREELRRLIDDAPVWKPDAKTAVEVFDSWESFESAPPVTFSIEEFLQNETATAIAGLSGDGKTWAALSIARSLLLGPGNLWRLFKVPERAEKVIYLVPECSRSAIKHRLQKMGIYEEIRSGRLAVRTLNQGPTVPLDDPGLLEAVRGAHVILDTAIRFMGDSDESNATEVAKGLSNDLLGLQRAGALTVIPLFHSPKSFRKDSEMTLENMIRGSGDLGAVLGGAWGLKCIDRTLNVIHVENLKPRDFAPSGPFQLIGRPYIDETQDFALHKPPEKCGRLADEQPQPNNKGRQEERGDRVQMVRKMFEKDRNMSIQEMVERFDKVGIKVKDDTVQRYRAAARKEQ